MPGTVGIGGLTSIGGNGFLPDNFYTNKFSEGDDVLWTHGSHSIKFGIAFDRIQDNTGPVPISTAATGVSPVWPVS